MNFQQHRIINNASWIVGIKIVQAVLGLIITMITARYFGPSNYGVLNYAAALVAFVTPVMRLGLPEILVQEFVDRDDQDGAILGTSFVLNMVSALGCIVSLYLFVSVVNGSEPTAIWICCLYSLLLLVQATEVFQYWFQGR